MVQAGIMDRQSHPEGDNEEDRAAGLMMDRPSRPEGVYIQGRSVPGYVLVIVNHEFKFEKKLKKGNDSEKIKKLFTTYGYEVRCFTNLSREEILAKVGLYSCRGNSNSLICFISSHGDQTSLACPDGEVVQIFDILKKAETKQLEKCPKVFFFDACRSQSGSLDGKSLPEPPTSNYYVGFSCLDTKYSFEGRGSCGAYFQELIKTFEDGFPRPHVEEGKVRDLNHFMNKVHYAVTNKYHQVPTIRTSLVGKIFFQKPEHTENVPKNTRLYHEQ